MHESSNIALTLSADKQLYLKALLWSYRLTCSRRSGQCKSMLPLWLSYMIYLNKHMKCVCFFVGDKYSRMNHCLFVCLFVHACVALLNANELLEWRGWNYRCCPKRFSECLSVPSDTYYVFHINSLSSYLQQQSLLTFIILFVSVCVNRES